jgi:hypothetical protein
MHLLPTHRSTLKLAAVLVIAGFGVSACATEEYVDKRIAEVNDHINAVDAKATDAGRRADAAASAAAAANNAAQSAAAAAQQAAADARNANQRLDALTPRVDTLEQAHAKKGRE